LRLSSLGRTHQSQQLRVLQTAAFDSLALNSLTKSCIPLQSFPKFQSFTNTFNPRQRPAMATLSQTQTRSHGGHSHHHHDNTYLTSTNKNDAGVRITRIGLYSNLGMAIAKGIGGYAFNSQSMIADAWHSLTDLASDILTLATVCNFPYWIREGREFGFLGSQWDAVVRGLLHVLQQLRDPLRAFLSRCPSSCRSSDTCPWPQSQSCGS
jgi:hypothetical protein